MANHLKKFFKSITKPNGHGTGSSGSPHHGGLLVDNQYSVMHESFTGKPQSRSPPNGMSETESNNGHASPPKPGSNHVLDASVRWGLVLSRIPKLVADCTNHGGNSHNSKEGSASPTATTKRSNEAMARGDLVALLEQLRQMSGKEYQTQILQYYTGSPSPSSNSSSSGRQNMTLLSNWEQRKVFKQCRRALLLGWKFILGQLQEEKSSSMTSERRELLHQIISLMMERVEFNLVFDGKEHATSMATPPPPSSLGRPPTATQQKQRSTSQSYSPSAATTASSSFPFDSQETTSDETADGERDLYLYRCLLVATFKLAIENMEAVKLKKRSFIPFTESQFYAKVIAVSFFRIPVIQRMILDQVFNAYRSKRWIKTGSGSTTSTTSSASSSQDPRAIRATRRRSSSKPWNGMTFTGSLSRWSEFEGYELVELFKEEEGDKAVTNETPCEPEKNEPPPPSPLNPFAPPSKSVLDKYRRQNPTLYRWTRYSPYLGPYADADVFRLYDSTIPAWLHTLVHDGEFFISFMSFYTQHVETISINEPVWYGIPGYILFIRLSLLLVQQAAWQKWIQIQETSENYIKKEKKNNEKDNEEECFVLKNVRAVKTVLDSVVHLLRNRETLESCVLALFECTNVFNSKSVGTCLSRLEEWFGAVAVPILDSTTNELCYKLPSSFHGQALAVGIRILLSNEQFEVLNRVLSFLYHRMDYFDGELRQSILKAIVQRHMYLFLHWNSDVRDAYHHLLVYKIVRVNRFLLESPMDQLLIGRMATFPTRYDEGLHRSDTMTSGIGLDDQDGMFDTTSPTTTRPTLTPMECSMLRTEQALWRAFDACLASICVQERKHARQGNRQYQHELHAAQCRAVAFKKLSKQVSSNSTNTSVNEGLPGGKPLQEVEELSEELHREPPYYLRYLPSEEVSHLDELRRLANTIKYPTENQIYAAHSLRHYSDRLKEYFTKLRQDGHVEAPVLGFC